MQSIGRVILKGRCYVYYMESKNFSIIVFAREVYVINNQKPLVSIFKKRCGNSVTMNSANAAKNHLYL